jgi:DNA polymerase-1
MSTAGENGETFYLIDGFAQIFRAYYAIRGGMNSPVTGEPTHAVFGFAGMLIKLLRDYAPPYVAVAFDAPGKTFRDDLAPDYKATRQPTPDDLKVQIPRIRELIGRFGLPVFERSGYEADDVIATAVRHVLDDAAYAGVEVRIVSKDKDLEQLLGPRVSLFDIHTDTLVDVAALWANKGIRPEQVIDVLTLMGDTSDNIRGVDGIGPKTAAQLIHEFGTLENLLANLDQIKGKRRENLEAATAWLARSRDLVTLRHDAEIDFRLADARPRPLDLDGLMALFEELGFHRFRDEVRQLAGAAEAPTLAPRPKDEPPAEHVAAGTGDYRCVTTAAELAELVERLKTQRLLAVDTETTGLERDARLCGVSLAWRTGGGVYVPTLSPEPERHLDAPAVIEALRPILEDEGIGKCGHNVKFDAAVLRRHGSHLRGVVCDTMLAGILLDPAQSSHKLDNLAVSILGRDMVPISDLIDASAQMSLFDAPGDGAMPATMEAVPLAKITPYAAEDADVALQLAEILLPRLDDAGMGELMSGVEGPLTSVLAEMEETGILCDPAELRRQGQGLMARVDELRAEIFALVGHEFALDSTKQLAVVLFDELGLAAGRKTKTGRSTDIAVLEKLATEEDVDVPSTGLPRLVIEYRQLTKLISTYLGNLADAVDPRDGRIHTTFHQMVTATGRLASNSPNLQNIPVRTEIGRQIRHAFIAPPEHLLLAADYSQVELRLLAHLSGDAGLIEAFRRGDDIHTAVAAQVFGVAPEQVTREQRGHAKTINFGIIYGVTPFGLARRIPGLDNAGAQRLIDDYKRRFPGIARFLAECVQHAESHGYVATILGRRRAIPELKSPNGSTRGLGERLAINSVVQGSAADLIKVAMVRLQQRIDREKLPLRMLLQIHDELIFEAPERNADELAAIVTTEMEQALTLQVPLEAECGRGRDWYEAK